MKVNDPNIPSAGITTGTTGANRAGPASRAGQGGGNGPAGAAPSSDDVHLSELVRSLRSLAADSPERQAKIEQLARSYANGSYRANPGATASAIIDDAIKK